MEVTLQARTTRSVYCNQVNFYFSMAGRWVSTEVCLYPLVTFVLVLLKYIQCEQNNYLLLYYRKFVFRVPYLKREKMEPL